MTVEDVEREIDRLIRLEEERNASGYSNKEMIRQIKLLSYVLRQAKSGDAQAKEVLGMK